MPTNIKLPLKPKTIKLKSNKGISHKPKRLINNITFFGDSAISAENEIYKIVYESAKLLAQNGYTIVNGGGPGLMKAATDGAESVNGKTAVVYWEPKLATVFEGKNLANIADETDAQSNYINRTFGLIEKGDAYVVCKGGTGTISEFGLVWALAKLYYGAHKPVILFGNFWKELVSSMQKYMLIDEKEFGVLYFAETPRDIMTILEHHELTLDRSQLKSTNGDEAAFLLSERTNKTKTSYDAHAQSYHSKKFRLLPSRGQLEEFAKMINPPAKVLDLGCGPGLDVAFLSEKYSVTGIEISKRFAQIAQFENPNTQIIHADMVKQPFGKEKFKGIWARDSFHHVEGKYQDELFKKTYEALVDGGIFYIIVREGEGEIVEKEQKSYGELERFYHFFTADELVGRAEKAGFKLVKLNHTQKSHKWIVGVFKK